MAVDVEIDVKVLRTEIKETYAAVSEEPGRDFTTTGRISSTTSPTRNGSCQTLSRPIYSHSCGPAQCASAAGLRRLQVP